MIYFVYIIIIILLGVIRCIKIFYELRNEGRNFQDDECINIIVIRILIDIY